MKWLLIVSLSLAFMQTEADTLTLYTEHFPPYSFEKNRQITGLNTEIVRRSCELAKIHCEFQLLPWLRAYEAALKNDRAGLFSTSRDPSRENLFRWVGPLAHSNAHMYWLKSQSVPPPRSLEDAKRFIVAVARGDIYELYLESKGFAVDVNLLQFNTKADAILPFLHGKVDLLIASEQVMAVWLAQHQYSLADVEAVVDLSDIGHNYLALNPQVPEKTLKRLQQAVERLHDNGEFKKLAEHFLHPAQ